MENLKLKNQHVIQKGGLFTVGSKWPLGTWNSYGIP
jgi:hypothetical protein